MGSLENYFPGCAARVIKTLPGLPSEIGPNHTIVTKYPLLKPCYLKLVKLDQILILHLKIWSNYVKMSKICLRQNAGIVPWGHWKYTHDRGASGKIRSLATYFCTEFLGPKQALAPKIELKNGHCGWHTPNATVGYSSPKIKLPGKSFCSPSSLSMMTSSNWNIFRVTGPLCGEFTGHRWIPRTKASDAELWCFLWSAPE